MFYGALAERTLIPAIRRVFEAIASRRRGTRANSRKHIECVCAPCDRPEKKP